MCPIDVGTRGAEGEGMRLHEFVSSEREQLLALCARKLHDRAPDRNSNELLGELPAFIDQVIGAIRDQSSHSPERPEVAVGTGPAAELGRQRKEIGFDVAQTVLSLGVVSDSLGELGKRAGLSFDAGEYQVFNQCFDDAMATALTEYWKLDRDQPVSDASVQLAFFAHELRNSLSSVQMAWHFLAGGHAGLGGRTAKVLERNLQRALDLIADTLTGAQLTARAPLYRTSLNVVRMLENLKAEAVLERNVSVSIRADPELVIEADEKILRSAVHNLLQNAIKFTRDGGAIEVRVSARDQEVLIEVEDECGGLPAGDPAQLFEPFVRGSDPRSTGVGLAIVRQAVLAHRGNVAVGDLPGKGCVFSIRLPFTPRER